MHRNRNTTIPFHSCTNVLMFSLFLLFAFVTSSESGCYQQRMCCHGRNVSCRSIDDGTRHLPIFNPQNHPRDHHHHRDHHHKLKPASYFTYQTPFYEASGDGYNLVYPEVFEEIHQQRIGRVVFPDVVELEGSGAEDIYNKYAPADDIFDEKQENNVPKTNRRQKKKTSSVNRITNLVFGFPQTPAEPYEDILRYTSRPKRLWIRYSVLDKYLPLTVSTTPASDYYDEAPQFMYLEAPPTSCYCDESCVALGDCCSDYTFVCPPRECVVSNWGEWEGCVADDGICGLGVEQRVRHVTQQPERGGTPCPPLREMRTCFKLCSKRRSLDDVTTVALLLDYRHNETRSKKSRDNIYWDMPSVYEKLKQATNYCVKYKIGWVNRNCWHKQITMRLYMGNTICAECQPEATLHRNNGRCASDLEDGEQGFWKLIGPKSCNGIWTRISRDDNCHCARDHSDLDPFLLV